MNEELVEDIDLDDGPPPKPDKGKELGFGCAFIVSLGVALFLSFVTFLGIPASQRLTHPVVCGGHVDTVVVTTVSSTSDGGTAMEAELFCIDDQGRAIPASSFLAFLVYFLEVWAAVLVLGLLLGLVSKLRGGRAAT